MKDIPVFKGIRADNGNPVEGYFVKLAQQSGNDLHIIIDFSGEYNRILPESLTVNGNSMTDDERIGIIADHYGFTSQANMLTEEAAEYTVALNKLRRGHADAYEHIKEEVADVIVVAKQLRYLLGADEIDRIIDGKLERQIERIKGEDDNVKEET